MSNPRIYAWVGEQPDRRLEERNRDQQDTRRYCRLTLTPENANRLAAALLVHAEKALEPAVAESVRWR